MNQIRRIGAVLLLAACAGSGRMEIIASPAKPNILLILADDMGFSDAGCFGGEIATPNLDGLARNGLRFTQFYNTARCWPTRAAILSGYYAHQVRRDIVPGVRSGGRGVRPAWAKLLPEMLKPVGYRCYHSGKWHVDGKPTENGFDHSYYIQDCGRFFGPLVHFYDDRKLPPIEKGANFYSTVAIADHAIQNLQEHAEKYSSQPFFEYLCFTAPHFPLQAPPEDIARYQNRYRQGWDAVREARWQRLKGMRIINHPLPAMDRNGGPPYNFPEALKLLGAGEVNRSVPWRELSDVQREFQSVKMAIHAAMIDRMDREIGRVLDQLRAMNALDNTLILFLSDNGASAEIMVRDEGHDPAASPGSAATHLCLGPGWSSAANTPLQRHNTWVHEGGISTPFIAHWPRGIRARGELRRTPGHVIDLVPTLLELAGGKQNEKREGQSVPPPGKSLVPLLAKDGTIARDYLWWEHEGNRALRVDDWKLVAAGKDAPWELYDLRTDRGESHNLAGAKPTLLRELADTWNRLYEEFCKQARQDLPAVPAR